MRNADRTHRSALCPQGAPAGMRDSTDLDARDARWRALLHLAGADVDARRVLLQAVVPGLVSVAYRYARPWDRDDIASAGSSPHWRALPPTRITVRRARWPTSCATLSTRFTERASRRLVSTARSRSIARRRRRRDPLQMSSSSWCVTPSRVGSSRRTRRVSSSSTACSGCRVSKWATETADAPRRCARPVLAPSVRARDQPSARHEREANDHAAGRSAPRDRG